MSAFLTIIVSACSNTKPTAFAFPQSDQPLYATLTKNDEGEWSVYKLSTSVGRPETSTYRNLLVDLETGSPIGLNTDTVKCSSMLWRARYNGKNPCISGPFRGANWNITTVPGYVFGGVFSFGIAWVIGWAPLDSSFDWDEYEEGVELALEKAGLSKSDLIHIGKSMGQVSSIKGAVRKQCDEISNLEISYRSKYSGTYAYNIVKGAKVYDKSGLLDHTGFSKGKLVDVNIKLESPNKFMAGCSNDTGFEIVIDSVGSLEKHIDKENKIEQAKLEALEDNKKLYEKSLLAGGRVGLSCSEGTLNSYRYISSCPKEIEFDRNGLNKSKKVSFTIQSKNIFDVLPKSYLNQDKNLKIEVLGGRLKITNLSKSYVNLEKLSLYYNQKVLSNGVFEASISELAPSSYVWYSMKKFDLNSLPNDYLAMSLNKAKSINVEFGISAKYKIEDRVKSLHDLSTYSLAKLL